MGLGSSLKNIYFACEDKWYGFWDKVDSKIPVYGVIEKIDKIIPSFVLFIIIIIALALFFSWGFIAGFFVQASFTVQVLDSAQNPLPNSLVKISFGDNNSTKTTNEFGETEAVMLPMGAAVRVTASKENFDSSTKETTISNANQKLEIILQSPSQENHITVLLKDEYNQPITDAVTVQFSCTNTAVSAPSTMTVLTGRLEIVEPSGCNGLIAGFDSSAFQKINSKVLRAGEQTVFMQSITTSLEGELTGILRVQLTFNGNPVTEQITVQLYRDNGSGGIGPIDSKISSAGIVEFTKAAGNYFVKTIATSQYGQAVSETTAVQAGKTASVTLALSRNIAGKITLQLKDSLSKAAIVGASVLLEKENVQAGQKTSDSNGKAEFFVMEDAAYTLLIDSENYCLKVLSGVRISASTQTIELTKFSGECGASLKVRVIDQDGKRVKNAVVGLYNEEGYSAGFANRVSDINGIAVFSRVPSGTYKAFAIKSSFSGWSDTAKFQQRISDATLLTVTMIIPDGTLRIKAVDSDGNPMTGADVFFYDSTTMEKIGSGSRPIENADGTIDFVSRADKKIFFRIEKSGMADYTSVVYPIVPSTVQEITAAMEKEIISGDIKISFLGFYKGSEIASVLAPGETYTAKLQVKVPVNKDYSKIGVHLRTGTSTVMTLDALAIKEINFPGKPSVIKATSFRPNNNYEQDAKNITADDAKWVNGEWTEFSTGTTNIEATIKVKETAKASDELVFWYRAYAVDSDGKYIRDKLDSQLGNSENTAKKQALYADAYQAAYNVGSETLCDETFCFSASILDIEAGISESATSSYNAKIFKDYAMTFAILNASKTLPYYGAELRILNEDEALLFGDYTINSAQNTSVSGTAAGGKIDWTNAGDLLPGTSIKGNLAFSTQKTANSQIKFQLRSAERIVFEKTIAIGISATKELSVTIVPEFLPSGIENKIIATVLDKETGLEIENALVKIEDRAHNVLSTATTNSSGKAELRLPSQQPGEKLFLIAEKPEYKRFEMEILVDDKIALLQPDKIGIALNAKTMQEADAEFTIKNNSNVELTVTNLSLEGKFSGLIDAQKAKNWLDTYLGEKISGKETKAFSLKATLTDLGKQVTETKTIDATLKATVSALGGEWDYEVPVVINIGVGGEVDNPNCFKITKREWQGFTEGQTIQIEFEIQNNCSANGIPVALNNVEAQVNWKGNEAGLFSVATEQSQADLVSGYFKRIAGRLAPEEKLTVTLSFIPSTGYGAVAAADIIFRAENPTDSETGKGTQELTDSLSANLTISNLLQCIGFDSDIITIKPEGTGSFSIETIGCGPSTDFRLESELELSKKRFTLKEKDSAKIDVIASGAIPGQYIVSIFAQGFGETQEKFIKNLRVRVQSDGCIELTKFEFDVFKNPNDAYSGYDTANLINHCYDKLENITVSWSEKDSGKAQSEGEKFAMLMGMANMMGQAGGPTAIFNKITSGTTSDYCLMDRGDVLYKKDNLFYSQNGQQVMQPAEGMCHPWIKADVYDTSGKISSTEYGFIKGNQLFDTQGKPIAGITYNPQTKKWGTTIPGATNPAAPAGTTGTPAGTTPTPPAGGTTPPATSQPATGGFVLPSVGMPTAATGTSGTYAGIPTQPTVPKQTTPSAGSASNNDQDSGMDSAMLPLLLGFTQMSGGEPSFLGSMLQGYMMGMQLASSKQAQGEFSYEAVLKDLGYSTVKLLMPNAKIEDGKFSEEYSTDITIKDLGEKSIEQREDNASLNNEKRKIAILNEAGVVQQDPSKPLFRIIQVRGQRTEYETRYETDSEEKPVTIRTKKTTPYVENFRIQVNAFNPVATIIEAGPIPNCVLGSLSGVTGEKAVPKILLQWDWASVKENTCDETNPNHVYCDATQFSIETLKKLETVKNFIDTHKPFDCPTGETAASVSEQTLSGISLDAGITKIQAVKTGNDANILVTIESLNTKEMQGTLTITINGSDSAVIATKTANFNLLSRQVVSQVFSEIPQGEYTVNAAVTFQLCENCENNDIGNDSISARLNMTSSGVGKCTPFNTKRLKDFIEATEANGNSTWSASEKENVLNAINFNALLIRDAYPSDFRKDFHDFCLNKSFFDCPDMYSRQNGWGEYFNSAENFKFDYGTTENSPLQAGKYNVVLNAEFSNENWDFFEENKLGAKITVEMTQLETPNPDSPFYYLPFDGRIGIDSENGRQGYGVNYRQESQETININNSSSQGVTTTNIASSTPAFGAWVSAGKISDFKTLNVDKRGIIMEVKAGEDSTSIALMPSYATPIIMNVSYSTGEDAFGFYSAEIDNAPQTALQRMIRWTGIGINCKDFKDTGMSDGWQDTWDTHGGITGNVKCAIGTQITDYGLEWCNPSRKGDVYLRGLVFTPQATNSVLKRKTYGDNMQLIGTGSSGTQVALNGVPGQEFNSFGVSSISSVEDVLKLVKDGSVCVVGASNRASSQFFWNPKPVVDALLTAEKKAQFEKSCIPAQ